MILITSSHSIPDWLDKETKSLIEDIINTLTRRHSKLLAVILYGSVARHEERELTDPDPSDVDLLAVLDSEDAHIVIWEGEALFHSLGLAYNRHLDTPRDVKVMFSTRTMQEWDAAFINNFIRDGILLFSCGTLSAPLTNIAYPDSQNIYAIIQNA